MRYQTIRQHRYGAPAGHQYDQISVEIAMRTQRDGSRRFRVEIAHIRGSSQGLGKPGVYHWDAATGIAPTLEAAARQAQHIADLKGFRAGETAQELVEAVEDAEDWIEEQEEETAGQ